MGTKIQDFAWNEVPAGKPLISSKVITTGPATLVAFWWGDAGVKHDKKAYPGEGFKLIDAVLESGALVQCAVAVKHVTEAGLISSQLVGVARTGRAAMARRGSVDLRPHAGA